MLANMSFQIVSTSLFSLFINYSLMSDTAFTECNDKHFVCCGYICAQEPFLN